MLQLGSAHNWSGVWTGPKLVTSRNVGMINFVLPFVRFLGTTKCLWVFQDYSA